DCWRDYGAALAVGLLARGQRRIQDGGDADVAVPLIARIETVLRLEPEIAEATGNVRLRVLKEWRHTEDDLGVPLGNQLQAFVVSEIPGAGVRRVDLPDEL